MYKLNFFLAMSALTFLINQAEAVEFDSENLFSEENKTLAHKLYWGSYKILEGQQEVPAEISKSISEKNKEKQRITYEEKRDFNFAQNWAHTVNLGNEKTRQDYKDQYNQLMGEFARKNWQNDIITETMGSMTLDNAYLPEASDIKYRDLEAFKKTAQDLYNLLESKTTNCVGGSKEENEKLESEARLKKKPEIIEKMLNSLKKFPEEVIDRILKVDLETFPENKKENELSKSPQEEMKKGDEVN